MDNAEANGLLDMLNLEAAHFARAVVQAEEASTTSEQVSWLSEAVESAFRCRGDCRPVAGG
jgi:hypothetical protein